jgi:integrase
MQLMALTFVRTSELIKARWQDFDFAAAEWRIPARVNNAQGQKVYGMKKENLHIVPLSPQAVEVLKVLQTLSGGRVLLFPGERDHDKPMSNNTILKALERMGYKGRMTGHGFRGVASTILHEQGYHTAMVNLQLAHKDKDEVSAAYNHALYLKERRAMMSAWADHLDKLRRGADVVPLRA